MKKRWTILAVCLLLSVLAFGCEAPTRYRVLCLIFDGVPPPKGLEPCDGTTDTAGSTVITKAGNHGENKAGHFTEHGPYAAKLCEGCHLRQTNKLILPVEELCFNCHAMETARRKVHGPLASGGCIICHNPHGSGNQFLLVSEPQGFCLYCHRKEDVLKNEAHKGTDEACTTCHNAHGSDNDYLLRWSTASARTENKQTMKFIPTTKQARRPPDLQRDRLNPKR